LSPDETTGRADTIRRAKRRRIDGYEGCHASRS
jgi:hypothetical protein